MYEQPDSTTMLNRQVYRPGYPFSYVELQTMQAEGVLRNVLVDVYAESLIPDTPELRATAASSLLSQTLRTHGSLCGESAAWIHLGSQPPQAVSLITQQLYRRKVLRAPAWHIHQIPLDEDEVRRIGRAQVTTPLRTATDLYMGIGTGPRRKRLDRCLHAWDDVSRHLIHWPKVHNPLHGRDEDLYAASQADHEAAQHRMQLIGTLMASAGVLRDDVVHSVIQRSPRSPRSKPSRAQVHQLLEECLQAARD